METVVCHSCFRSSISFQRFVVEVKTKGGSKYLIYRRYREFFNLHQTLEAKYSPQDGEKRGPNTCVLPSLPGENVHRPGIRASHFTCSDRRCFMLFLF